MNIRFHMNWKATPTQSTTVTPSTSASAQNMNPTTSASFETVQPSTSAMSKTVQPSTSAYADKKIQTLARGKTLPILP